MDAVPLLHQLRQSGAMISLAPTGRVRVEAPTHLLDDALREAIRTNRESLIKALREEQAAQVQEWEFASFASFASETPAMLGAARTQRTQDSILDDELAISLLDGLASGTPDHLPPEWQAGLQQLSAMGPLSGFAASRWCTAQRWAVQLALDIGAQASSLGWRMEDLFGLHPAAPAARYDGMGLAFRLRPGDQVRMIRATGALIIRTSGARQTFARLGTRAETRLAWSIATSMSTERSGNGC